MFEDTHKKENIIVYITSKIKANKWNHTQEKSHRLEIRQVRNQAG